MSDNKMMLVALAQILRNQQTLLRLGRWDCSAYSDEVANMLGLTNQVIDGLLEKLPKEAKNEPEKEED